MVSVTSQYVDTRNSQMAVGSTFIEFDLVCVEPRNLIGKENAGFAMMMSNFNQERLILAFAALRLSRVCAEDAYNHSVARETFGQKLIVWTQTNRV